MHALILTIVLFLSNGQTQVHLFVQEEAGSRDVAMQACKSSIPEFYKLLGATNKEDPSISIADVQGVCTFVEAGQHT